MGKVLDIGGGIVNPMSHDVLTLTVNDTMQVNLQCQLPPEQAIKVLNSVVTDIMVSYMKSLATATSGSLT